jgi:hypothetical protein
MEVCDLNKIIDAMNDPKLPESVRMVFEVRYDRALRDLKSIEEEMHDYMCVINLLSSKEIRIEELTYFLDSSYKTLKYNKNSLNDLFRHAVRRGDPFAVHIFLQYIHDFDNDMILYALKFDWHDITVVLIAYAREFFDKNQLSILVNYQDTELGECPLTYAIKNNNIKTVKLLLANGAYLNLYQFMHSRNDPDPFAAAIVSGNINYVRLLLEHGADINRQNNKGRAPLHLAAIEHPVNYELLSLLLDKGANVNAKDRAHKTPLYWIAARGSQETAELFLEHGADMHIEALNKQTPFLESKKWGSHKNGTYHVFKRFDK